MKRTAELSAIALLVAAAFGAAQARAPVNAGTETGQALTAPPVQETFSMVLFGDRTVGLDSGLEVLREAVRMTNRLAPDFVVTVGDMVNGYNVTPEWLAQARRYKRIMAGLKMPWYPVVGNHDVYGYRGAAGGNLENFKKHFGPLYYSFDYRFAHIIALFSDEKLSFANPPEDQNMSKAQMAWLRKDLASTRARIVFCFLHHPRWTARYRGCNWPRVHEILKRDGRVKAVFAGHLHLYRDDGIQDGIHYYTLATTGGQLRGLRQTAALHHVDHVRVWPDRIAIAVVPVGSIRGADMVRGAEVDEMLALGRGEWLRVEGQVVQGVRQPRRSRLKVVITNAAGRPVMVHGRLRHLAAWKVASPPIRGALRPGQRVAFAVTVTAPPFGGRRPFFSVEATLDYRLKSGLTQPIEVRRSLPVTLAGLTALAAARSGGNRVLALDGRSAVRVDLPPLQGPFTLECWARGAARRDRAGLVARTQQSNFGLFWTPLPRAYVFVARRGRDGQGGRGYLDVEAGQGWSWRRWNHLAMTYDGRECRFYVNGRLQGRAAGTGLVENVRYPLYVGADPDGRGRAAGFFRGAIDEVRLSRAVRYARDFAPASRFARDADTLLLLHFDSDVRGVFPDDSGRGHHGWPVGRPRRAAEPRPGPGRRL